MCWITSRRFIETRQRITAVSAVCDIEKTPSVIVKSNDPDGAFLDIDIIFGIPMPDTQVFDIDKWRSQSARKGHHREVG